MKILLVTPPFTQLNTPYPATAYLKGFLNTLGKTSYQCDLGLEVILEIFCSNGLKKMFEHVGGKEADLTENAFRIFAQRQRYIQTIDDVINFLQNKNQTLAITICLGGFLPQASRFNQELDVEWAFGTMGTHDKARHLVTLYLEDLGDFITETIDTQFGFSRYAERLARTATHFDDMYTSLTSVNTFVSDVLISVFDTHMKRHQPDIVCLTAPFPGNVFSAFKCGQYIKSTYPHVRIIFGGGYANTELRSIYDERVFEFVDYITLDDGEAPLQHLLEHLEGKRDKSLLKRTFCLSSGVVTYINGSQSFDIPQREVGTPDYRDLLLDKYISVIEVINPMHRLWSDGRWNKLTLAHGCYWGKCSFCDVTLDYIKRYEPVSAELLCDRIVEIITQTGQNGFHFVDEAAPPALMRDVAIEILRRGLTVVWWTNIRFEKSFTKDLCTLLRASGCIAVSGGLEVASDRLLEKMKKGVTVAQVARVAQAFTDSGIMVHAYLMYGFPTQTAQETIDSLEMVRQLFQEEVIQSGFWHQFAMTAHSPVGMDPASFGVKQVGPDFGGFAENDFFHEDSQGADHELFSEGLKRSVYNYMQGAGIDESTDIWFDFDTPFTTIDADYIVQSLFHDTSLISRPHDQLVWLGGEAIELIVTPVKKSTIKATKRLEYAEIIVCGKWENYSLYFDRHTAEWIILLMEEASPMSGIKYTFEKLKLSYEATGLIDFDDFIASDAFDLFRSHGLVFV